MEVRKIYESVASLDACISIASYLEEIQSFTNPVFNLNGKIGFMNIYHPLLDNPVPNTIDKLSKSALITGSNMSGKTTFIRCVGVNLILAQTLYFCHADKFETHRYIVKAAIKREEDLQIIYRLTWFASDFDVNREPNNGRGPVDYAISKGAKDKTLIEFKLASNSKLKQNLAKQVEVYEKANSTNKSIKVILYFNATEFNKIQRILKELGLEKSENIDRKSTRLNSSHIPLSRMPSSA